VIDYTDYIARKLSTGHAIAVLYESGELPTIAAPELAEPTKAAA